MEKTFKDYEYQRPSLEKVEAEFNRSSFKGICHGKILCRPGCGHGGDQRPAQRVLHPWPPWSRLDTPSIPPTLITRRRMIILTRSPLSLEAWFSEYYQALVQSEYRPQLEEKWGRQLFRIAETPFEALCPGDHPRPANREQTGQPIYKAPGFRPDPLCRGGKEPGPDGPLHGSRRTDGAQGVPTGGLYRVFLPPMRPIRRDLRPIGEGPRIKDREKIGV